MRKFILVTCLFLCSCFEAALLLRDSEDEPKVNHACCVRYEACAKSPNGLCCVYCGKSCGGCFNIDGGTND